MTYCVIVLGIKFFVNSCIFYYIFIVLVPKLSLGTRMKKKVKY